VIAKSDSAIISWDIPSRATFYHVYLVLEGLLVPINDGEGLNVVTNQVTIYSVFFLHSFIPLFFFFFNSLSFFFFFFFLINFFSNKKTVKRMGKLYNSDLCRKFRRI